MRFDWFASLNNSKIMNKVRNLREDETKIKELKQTNTHLKTIIQGFHLPTIAYNLKALIQRTDKK